MKESKTSVNNEKNKLVRNENLKKSFEKNDELEKFEEEKFNEDLKEIKDKLNAQKLSDEFKEKLQAKLDEEYNKTVPNKKGKILKFPAFSRQLAGICACFILLCSGCIAFADDIENVILRVLGDTDRIVENAIANGNYREVDMEYVENNGVSIKVDYVVVEEDSLYIAFNVLAEEDFDNVFFENITVNNEEEIVYKSNERNTDINKNLNVYKESIDKNNIIYTYKINTLEKVEKETINNVEININNIQISNKGILSVINGEWNFKI